MGTLDARVRQWIADHEEELTQDIRQLVRIRSVSQKGADGTPFGQGCRDALHAALEMGARYGFATENYGDAVGMIDMGRPGEEIAFWGHLDVVPEGSDWDYPPYEGIVRDGAIIGRGSQDNKGQTVAALYVMRCIRDLDIPLRHNLRLYLGTNEEAGMEDVAEYLKEHEAPAFSIIPDCDFPVCYGEKGILTLDFVSERLPAEGRLMALAGGTADNVVPDTAEATIAGGNDAAQEALRETLDVRVEGDALHLTAHGTAGHTAFPQNSVNAIYVLTQALEKAGVLLPEESAAMRFPNLVNHDCFGEATGAACQDDMSGRMTMVGSILTLRDRQLHLTVNIRYPVTGDAERILATLDSGAKAQGYTMHARRHSPSHLFPREHPVVDALTGVYNRMMGVQREPYVLSGGTYARMFKNALSFGMGLGRDGEALRAPVSHLFREGHGGAHGPDEYAVIGAYQKGMEIFVQGLLAIDEMDLSGV